MHLSSVRIRNFRKFGPVEVLVPFQVGLNVLVGENDSGKSCIADALKLILGTHSNDWIRIETDDFHIPQTAKSEAERAPEFEIQCEFVGIDPEKDGKYFIEWLGVRKLKEQNEFFLTLTLRATRRLEGSSERINYSVKAGPDDDGIVLESEARQRLRVLYLKPLRDAETELVARKGSRLSQILASHEVFTTANATAHPLENIVEAANQEINNYFEEEAGMKILSDSNKHLEEFSASTRLLTSTISISGSRLKSILEKLELIVSEKQSPVATNLGLGSHNLLFIAAELLLLKNEQYEGLKLALIEELEAHLHPQAQLRLIEYLHRILASSGGQLVLTTHSLSLTSKVGLANLLLCRHGSVFPMGEAYTKLAHEDYEFLGRFIDDTKANLFFANGVLLVEGISENLLLPALAEVFGRPLHKYGVSIVNVGGAAFLRYARIFQRKDDGLMNIPVAIVTDRDIPPRIAKTEGRVKRLTEEELVARGKLEMVAARKKVNEGGDVKVFVSPKWTLEFDLALGLLRELLEQAVSSSSEEYDDESSAVDENNDEGYPIATEEDAITIAWRTYSPLYFKRKSKAETAQRLSSLLRAKAKSDPDFVQKLLEDPYVAYLRSAIEYVTEPILQCTDAPVSQ